ncbi:MAG: hypothetical protein ACM30E_12990 [Nitrososphaerales archaeon]
MNDSPAVANRVAAAAGPNKVAGPRRPRRALPVERPAHRYINAYAFDPSLSLQLENAALNQIKLQAPWEYDPVTGEDILQPGPVGEYLEVVDVDPASGCFYAPIDLNQPYLLAADGLHPSEGNPQFHQQMAYAVAMTTIKNFERALGRPALWSTHYDPDAPPNKRNEFIRRLRIYPHALREANAFYSPEKKALLFGYFPAPTDDVRFHLPGGMVFCCLSHDVVAHETTHALLDGMHRRFIEASNHDVLAFHEAFADICALFQHFSLPDVLRAQIGKTRGDLSTENLLGQLAQEFGYATGLHGALRDALGAYDPATGRWERTKPDPLKLQTVTEPHARGSILVAAVFEAFLLIYRRRTADLLRIATGGTGVLPQGALPPDLLDRLAEEAAGVAQDILNMCIRALDYMPPVDPTFGDYLRALITADYDLVRDDKYGYRLAVLEAFREYGIYPEGVQTLAIDSLRWQPPLTQDFQPQVLPLLHQMRRLAERQGYTNEREKLHEQQEMACAGVHEVLVGMAAKLLAEMGEQATTERFGDLGLDVTHLLRKGAPVMEVHSARPARRVGPTGEVLADAIIQVTQRRPGYLDPQDQDYVDRLLLGKEPDELANAPDPDFWFRGGATLVVDLERGTVRYAIVKDIWDSARLARQRAFHGGAADASLRALYFGGAPEATREPFAFIHRMG